MATKKKDISPRLEMNGKKLIHMVSYDLIAVHHWGSKMSMYTEYNLAGLYVKQGSKQRHMFEEKLEWISFKSGIAQTDKSILILPKR